MHNACIRDTTAAVVNEWGGATAAVFFILDQTF